MTPYKCQFFITNTPQIECIEVLRDGDFAFCVNQHQDNREMCHARTA